MWIDSAAAFQKLEAKRQQKLLTNEEEKIIINLIYDGVAIWRGAQDRVLCDEAVMDFNRFLKNNPGGDNRVVNFHMDSDAALQLACNTRIIRLLSTLFENEAVAYSSLTFAKGTEQPIHRDAPHFTTYPSPYRFFGVWTALEDISIGQGALEYYPGGHRLAEETPAINWKLTKEQIKQVQERYEDKVVAAATGSGLARTQTALNKGDVIIWHPLLPHGGGRILIPGATRYSMVTHYIPHGYRVGGADYYFDKNLEGKQPIPAYLQCDSSRYIKQPQPFYQKSYI
jgi:phytanoyl-CoA hydroxylase